MKTYTDTHGTKKKDKLLELIAIFVQWNYLKKRKYSPIYHPAAPHDNVKRRFDQHVLSNFWPP